MIIASKTLLKLAIRFLKFLPKINELVSGATYKLSCRCHINIQSTPQLHQFRIIFSHFFLLPLGKYMHYTKSIHTYMYSYIHLFRREFSPYTYCIFDLILRARRTVNSHTYHAQCNPITINARTLIVLDREHTVIIISHTENACVTVLKFFILSVLVSVYVSVCQIQTDTFFPSQGTLLPSAIFIGHPNFLPLILSFIGNTFDNIVKENACLSKESHLYQIQK